MKVRAFKIPLSALLITVLLVAIGELACGTSVYFVVMMVVTLLSIGITFNMLGGLSTLSGLVFAGMALRWVVISQFAKVILLQAADSRMEVPTLTSSVYALFFICVAIGVFLFGRVRANLFSVPEPATKAHSTILYLVALPVGLLGTILFNLSNVVYSSGVDTNTQFNSYHSLGVALQVMLLFSLVIAVDARIRKTEGRHSFGIAASLPFALIVLNGFVNTVRSGFVEPVLLYLVTCYFRGYRFRLRHILGVCCSVLLFIIFISPLEIYSRGLIAGLGMEERIYQTFYLLRTADWPQIRAASEASTLADQDEDYYGLPGTFILSRVSRIRMDSNLIAACAHYHYGFTAVKTDLLAQVPHVLYRDKPVYGSADFLGRVSGVSADVVGNTEPAFTMVSDSFGAFGWLGLTAVGLFLVPLTFALYESMFDMKKPWGTVALLSCAFGMSEGGLGTLIAVVVIRIPVELLVASYLMRFVTRLIPVRVDSRSGSARLLSHDEAGGISHALTS